MTKTNLNKTSNYLIKILIIILSFGFIIHRLVFKYNSGDFLKGLEQIMVNPGFLVLLILVLLMMSLNWGLETLKWRFLIKKIEKLSFVRSLIAVFAGITIGTFTPNRIGENIGRAFILEHANRWEGMFITFIGSVSQILITLLFGSAAFFYFFNTRYDYFVDHHYAMYLFLLVLAWLMTIVTAVLYFRIAWLEPFIRWFVPGKYTLFISHLKVFANYNTKELMKVLFLSFCRYVVFTFQFYLLLHVCQIPFSILQGMIYISMMYLFLSAVPTITLTEVGVRGSISIFLLEIFYFNDQGLLSELASKTLLASFLLWIINLIIPALIGEFFIVKLKFLRK